VAKSARDKLRDKALATIRRNIKRDGFHIYQVMEGSSPRYAYTIGLTESHGAELVLAGSVIFDTDEVVDILHTVRRKWKGTAEKAKKHAVKGCGAFTLRTAHPTWVTRLALGARDYYQRDIVAFQLVPDAAHHTIDVPDMRAAYNSKREPVWQCLDKPWPYKIDEDSSVATNLAALRGAPITEVVRWEADYWEAFAGDGTQTKPANIRFVSPLVLIAGDPALAPILKLEVGNGLCRTSRGKWQTWKRT
jgi:hypothetical protein